jgi:hypothetical protein
MFRASNVDKRQTNKLQKFEKPAKTPLTNLIALRNFGPADYKEMNSLNKPPSLITRQETELAFRGRILNKYDVNYYRCVETGFIQTEKPYWLEEAYSSAISVLDVGYIQRNIDYSKATSRIISKCFPNFNCGLDYGGGYGMFVRLMRDRGFPFIRQDVFCENLFATYFDVTNYPSQAYTLVTAFEVFEHLTNPIESVAEMFDYAPTILFSTELQPNKKLTRTDDWWYFVPETGQHISLYTPLSLQSIAARFKAKFFSLGNLHIMTTDSSLENPLAVLQKKENFFSKLIKKSLLLFDPDAETKTSKSRPQRHSLLEEDFLLVRNHLCS